MMTKALKVKSIVMLQKRWVLVVIINRDNSTNIGRLYEQHPYFKSSHDIRRI